MEQFEFKSIHAFAELPKLTLQDARFYSLAEEVYDKNDIVQKNHPYLNLQDYEIYPPDPYCVVFESSMGNAVDEDHPRIVYYSKVHLYDPNATQVYSKPVIFKNIEEKTGVAMFPNNEGSMVFRVISPLIAGTFEGNLVFCRTSRGLLSSLDWEASRPKIALVGRTARFGQYDRYRVINAFSSEM